MTNYGGGDFYRIINVILSEYHYVRFRMIQFEYLSDQG